MKLLIYVFKNIILMNKESKLTYLKNALNYFCSIFSILLSIKEILEILEWFGVVEFNSQKPITILVIIFLTVIVISNIMSYLKSKKYLKKKYRIDKERHIEIRVGDYVENASQIINHDNNLENKPFFVFGTNSSFKLDFSLEGSLQYDFVESFLKSDIQNYQLMINNLLKESKINPIGVQRLGCDKNYYLSYNLGTILEIKFPSTDSQMENRFSLLLFADSKKNKSGSIVGDRCTLNDIKNIWEYTREQGYYNRRLLIPLLGTGNAKAITCMESALSIIDCFFDDISANKCPVFKEVIISIRPDAIGDSIDLTEIDQYIKFKSKYR